MAYLKLALFGLLSPLLVLLLLFINKWKRFHALNYWIKQVIYGVLFGGIAVLCTEFGVKNNGAVLNVRDSAVIAAGLIYGWPAGLISGTIGGVERFFSTYWTGASYTQIACSISTFVSGALAGVIRRFVFKNKRAKWFQALGVGVVLETSHILMIFVTNMDDVIYAFGYVSKIGNPMIIGVGVSVMISALIMDIARIKEKLQNRTKSTKWHISTILHTFLFSVVTFAYLNVALFSYNIQNRIAKSNGTGLLTNAVTDMSDDVSSNTDTNLLYHARDVQKLLEGYYTEPIDQYSFNNEFLMWLINPDSPSYMHVSEINYIDKNGIITVSSADWVGYDMRDGEQSYEFVQHLLINGEEEFVQEYRATSGDSELSMKYAGRLMEHGGFIQVGYSGDLYYSQLKGALQSAVKNRHVGKEGMMVIADQRFNVIGNTEIEKNIHIIKDLGFTINLAKHKEGVMYSASYDIGDGPVDMRFLYVYNEGFYIIGIINEDEIAITRDMSIYVLSYLELITFALVFFLIYIVINRFVLKDLDRVNEKLNDITNGQLDTQFDINSTEEFLHLSTSLNNTVNSLKESLAKEAKRMEEELGLAKAIQLSSLPSQLAYVYQHEFAVYALMQTAKQVGGDFYDYFQLADGRFAIVIADVSGKGVPAALFMMRAKSQIKSLLETGMSIQDAIDRSNKRLCEGNEAEMFVTCWAATIDTKTGKLEYVNAGHNPPLIKRNGKYEYLMNKPNFVLGAINTSKYTKYTMDLEPGDVIFLYTDGITEAQNIDGQFYGENRLMQKINTITTLSAEKICKTILEDTLEFTGEHDQSDDMTMLTFAYYGKDEHIRFTYDPEMEEFAHARDDLAKFFNERGVDEMTNDKFQLALEELFVNIVSYGYPEDREDKGKIIIDLSYSKPQISMTITDSALRFNPLAKDDPDISLDANEREIGGLGIFMVKKMMDNIYYSYQNNKNILTMTIFAKDKGEK